MAQNLVNLFGSVGAARFLELLASPYRKPVWELHALSEDGTLRLDLTPYLKAFTSPQMTDSSGDVTSASGTFSIANPNGLFDRYAGGANADVLVRGRLLRFRKGLLDWQNGDQAYLLPAAYGDILQAKRGYRSSGDTTVEVTFADALKDAVKIKLTSDDYQNTEANLIAADLLKRYGKFTDARLSLAAISHSYVDVQFPDYTLADSLKTLFDPLLLAVRADEAGNIATRPRLGSGLSSMSTILGYPDQASAPPDEAVDYVIPDSIGIETIDDIEQDWDGVYNQVKVMGQAGDSLTTLGPNQTLYTLSDSSVASDGKLLQQYAYSDNGSSSTNAVLAKNVYVEFLYSTNHNLDTSPRTEILSLMNWRGDWTGTTTYAVGDAVTYGGTSYACQKDGAGSSQPPTDTDYWQAIAVSGPFAASFSVQNEDPREVGYVTLEAVTDTYLVLRIEGRQYSSGHLIARHHGGFDFRFLIHGQPVASQGRTLTAFADYGAVVVAAEALSDVFGDHQTYQAAHQPLAMSGKVTVYKDAVKLGSIAADQTDLSGETLFKVDYERGRIVLADLSYIDWSEDDAAAHPLSTGGTAHSTTQSMNLSLLQVPAPEAIYQTNRQGNSQYVFTGLAAGMGYNVRLHFADPDNTDTKKRLFSVYVQGVKVIEGLDIVAKTGGRYFAWQEEVTGIAPDSSGNIRVLVTQNDPYASGGGGSSLLPECSDNGSSTGTAVGSALVCGIEILLPQGQGASPYAVNSGGPAYGPSGTGANHVAPPAITADYSYSPIQQTYQIQQMAINNPLIASQADCQTVANYWVNYSQWKCFQMTIRVASLPHLQPGDLIKFFHPTTGVDFWAYVPQVGRAMSAPSGGTGGTGGSGGADADTYLLYVIFAQKRP